MNSAMLSKLKTARAGVALFGVVAMLSFSACSATPAIEDKPTTEPQSTSSSDAGIDASATPEPTEDSLSTDDTDTGYPAPAVGGKTSAGEPIADAEDRFIAAAKKRVEDAGSDATILRMGYETCAFYADSTTDTELFEKLEDASSGDHQTEVNYLYISGAASKTLCPEYAEFGE